MKEYKRMKEILESFEIATYTYTYISLAPAGIFSGGGRGGSEVHQGRACKGGRRVGGSGGSKFFIPPDAG